MKEKRDRDPQIIVRVDRKIHAELKKLARQERRTMGAQCALILKSAMERPAA